MAVARVVGYSRALEMALTCRAIESEARDWELVTHVVERDALIDTALAWRARSPRFRRAASVSTSA